MQSVNKKSLAKQGFTLIELLIVIAIIGLLATLAIVSLTTAQRKARDTKRVADIKQLQNAVELYYSEHAAYPLTAPASNLASTPSATVATWPDFGTVISPYITNVPIDPTNTTTSVYTYGANLVGNEYFISAKLEDTSHAALNGDDDTNYIVGTTSGWGTTSTVDFVASSDTTVIARTAMDCGTATVDTGTSGSGIFCASE